ncbi:uncharacterized protein LOC129618209 [Condylostylus longicornis]|uniref:uncharacterized protein LOC129618209 n=1 Tax=Condylostylus longicornis TaxID=2530218 RepID=UPI00244DEC9F|nr:uncharacterized protein LOC129618209 [Condylostylus longicornis]
MGQESSLLPRNPYENYPNCKSNHQKFLVSGTEHYSDLRKYHKSKLNLSNSNNSLSTTTTLTHLHNTNNSHHQQYQHHYRDNSTSSLSTIYGNATYVDNTWNCTQKSNNQNKITIVDKIPNHLPPPPPLPCTQTNLPESGFDRYQRIKKSTSRSSFASYTDYSSCYCSSNSSALSSASKRSQEKQANYLNHHLYIKSYLDILEEDEKAKKQFIPRPGIRNYKPKILYSETSNSITRKESNKNNKDSGTWI